MPIEDLIIFTYCFVDDFLKAEPALRKSGPAPKLTDAEVVTMEIVAEFLGIGYDKGICDYFRSHWLPLFPKMGCRTTFTRQMNNLWAVKDKIRRHLVQTLRPDNDLFLFDGFPIPTCHPKRVGKKNPLRGQAAFGYCAAKDKKYFGFKGHLVTDRHGLILNFTIAPANIDERDVLPELVENTRGILIADKGLIRPELKKLLASHGMNLQTPLRSNMQDPRPKSPVRSLMNMRRKIETVIGQLVERFSIQSLKVKDLWHLSAKTGRKMLAHTFAFFIKESLKFDEILI